MGLRPLCIINSSGEGVDYRRQNLTSINVRLGSLKSVPVPKDGPCATSSWQDKYIEEN